MTRTIAALCCLLMTLVGAQARAASLEARPVPPPIVRASPPTEGAPANGGKHLRITPLFDENEVAAGKPFDLVLATRPEAGWHGYWGENPGDAGFPPKLRWTAPAGTRFGAWRWPVPTTLKIAGLMNYVYDAPFAPVIRVTLPPRRDSGGHQLTLHLSYLVCTDSICVPEEQDVGIVAGMDDALEFYTAPDLDRWRAALPRPLGSVARYQADAAGLRIAVPYPASAPLRDAYFFPVTTRAIDHAAPQTVTRDGDRLLIETGGKPAAAFEGVLRVGPGQGLRVRVEPGVVPAAQGWLRATLAAFGLAVLGGLILNIMPCVFPILSLKALSLTKSGGDGAKGEALSYTAGVVAVCVALGAAILLLRAGGSAVGWAFQLTDPRTVALLLALAVAIAANLSGLWEVPALSFERAGGGQMGAFATGALAAFVATPCTGPFMAAALGAALVLPWVAGLLVFAGLGLGLALPFLFIGFVPALRRRLPKPGAWMERFRRVLAVPMWLTAAALVWLLWRQGVYGALISIPIWLLVVLTIAGRRQRAGKPAGVVLAIAAVGLAAPVTSATRHARVAAHTDASFSEARLAQLRAQGKPVFAYFTADWCLTCKVNERVAIEPSRGVLAKKGVAVLVGDWTGGDPALGRFIEAHGRAGVPLYLYYAPGQEARVLPQVLTPGVVTGL